MDACLQVHGAGGSEIELEIERAVRHARLGPIGGGTDEIMNEVLGRSLGLWSRQKLLSGPRTSFC